MRKGISFTLTIIITAVVLMTAALTLVTLFGSSVGSFFGTISETGKDARIRQKCSTVVRNINDACSNYYFVNDNGEVETSNFRRPPNFEQTCNDRGCGIDVGSGGELSSDNEIFLSVDGNQHYIGVTMTVDVEGDQYRCDTQGDITSSSCPVDIN